ncbi:MAG: hypothetical protein WCZ28_06195 [Burkholderiaceae bacterium]
MKIAIYAIAKDEARFVDRFMASAADADHIVIGDTGSTDETALRAKGLGADAYPIYISPWRFDLARNAVLALIPADVDVCVPLDLDEVLEPGWRAEIERVWEPGRTTRLRYVYDWSGGVVFVQDKIHARHGYRWHHPCHEVVVPDGRTQEIAATTGKLLMRHLPDATKSRSQYLDLLELAVKEDPTCPRNAFYYGRELVFCRRPLVAVAALQRFLAMPEATWGTERAAAMRMLGRACDALEQRDMALAWYRRGTAEAPGEREPWVALAKACYERALWPECFAAARTALALTDRPLVYTSEPEAWGARPHDLLALAAHHLGLREEALEHGRKALELAPGDERLRANLTFYEQGASATRRVAPPLRSLPARSAEQQA